MELRPAGLVLLGMLAACGPPPLQPDGTARPSLTDLLRRSDAILVATAGKVTTTSKYGSDGCARLMRVMVSPENVLAGHPPSRSFDEYYFSPRCGSSDYLELPKVGSRGVLFLRKEHGYWRTVADYWGFIPVHSGGHAPQSLAGKPVERQIAEILLKPGEGYSPGEFALDGEASDAARALIGPGPANQLIQSLLDHPDIRVRVAACVALARDDRNASCASRVLSAYLDRFEKGDFTGISRSLVIRLRALEGYAEPSVRSRAPYLLYEASAAAGLP
jgi:hypothetical protein